MGKVQRGQGPKVQRGQGPKVQRGQGPKVQRGQGPRSKGGKVQRGPCPLWTFPIYSHIPHYPILSIFHCSILMWNTCGTGRNLMCTQTPTLWGLSSAVCLGRLGCTLREHGVELNPALKSQCVGSNMVQPCKNHRIDQYIAVWTWNSPRCVVSKPTT